MEIPVLYPSQFQGTEQSGGNERVDEQQSLGVFRTMIGYTGTTGALCSDRFILYDECR